MTKFIVFAAVLATSVQICLITGTSTAVIERQGDGIQPSLHHLVIGQNDTQLPLENSTLPMDSHIEPLSTMPMYNSTWNARGDDKNGSKNSPHSDLQIKTSESPESSTTSISSSTSTSTSTTSTSTSTSALSPTSSSSSTSSSSPTSTSTEAAMKKKSSTTPPVSSNVISFIKDHGDPGNKTETEDNTKLEPLIPNANVSANIYLGNPQAPTVFRTDEKCPTLIDADSLSQTQLIERLTASCRYDRLERPITYNTKGERLPVDVYARAYVYFMQNLEAHDLQFKMHALLQLRFVDPRLVFKEVAPKRTQSILGEKSLRDTLWVPHIFFANERDSSILGTAEKDVLTSISPDGTVIVSTRIQATLYCWMNLQKFPFDEQFCSTILESWMYNTSELVLHWENKSPVTFDPDLHLTEYILLSAWSNETVVNADLRDLRHGAFAGNYSSLSFTVHLTREIGFYLMDYFLPSMMIVAISWVSFWLQADQSAPRIMLGTSTMLTFITLASAQGKTLPKVSYIKVSEVWFLGCTLFIFGSLVEFAFVNTIWRRKKNVELKKINSKYILKSTLTPRLARKDLGLQKSRSCSSLDGSQNNSTRGSNNYNNYLTVHTLPIITTQCDDDFNGGNCNMAIDIEKGSTNNMSKCNSAGDNYMGGNNNRNENQTWTTMTPQEISIWIDRRARFIFPLAFIVFNALFWTFVYCL